VRTRSWRRVALLAAVAMLAGCATAPADADGLGASDTGGGDSAERASGAGDAAARTGDTGSCDAAARATDSGAAAHAR
jgi:hypothetical protein